MFPSKANGVIQLGAFSYTKVISATAVNIAPEKETPAGFTLRHNYPNPFNPSTTIEYSLPEMGHTRLTIYITLGQEVALLVNERQDSIP